MNEKLIAAYIEQVERTLSPDDFFQPGKTTINQISDLRWSLVRIARAVAAVLPEKPQVSDESIIG